MFLNEYQKLRELGKGSFAKVYKVRHEKLGYIRAIRVLNEIIDDENDKCYLKFLEECKTLLRLGNGGHPNIVHIYQPRLLQNHALVEMDYIDGLDLDDYLKEQNTYVEIDEVMRFAENICSALAYCHEDIYQFCMDREADDLQDDPDDGRKVLIDKPTRLRLIEKYGVTHNDIHSKNIMRKGLDGSFVLLDFGLAIQDGVVIKSSTRRGGAPEYKAPEKWENNGDITPSTDIYSFGILLYEMLAGQVPFPYDQKLSQQRAEYELSEHHLKTTPPAIEPLRRAAYETVFPDKTYKKDYPDWLERVIMKCLEKAPQDRYRNGKELYEKIMPQITSFKLRDNEEINRLNEKIEKLKTREPSVVEKIIKEPFIVEKIVEKTVTKEIVVRKNNPIWIALCIVFALLSVAIFGFYFNKTTNNTPTDVSSDIVQPLSDNATNQAIIVERDDLKKENEKLKQENNQLKSSSNSNSNNNNEELQKLKTENNNLKSTITSKDKEIDKLEKDKKLINSSTSNNNAELQKLKTENDNLKSSVSSKNSTIEKLEKDKTLLNSTITRKDNEIKGLRTTIDELLKKK